VVDRKASVNASQKVQYADSFSGKLSKGVHEGTQKAKASLKNSFSFWLSKVPNGSGLIAFLQSYSYICINSDKPKKIKRKWLTFNEILNTETSKKLFYTVGG